MRTAHQPMTSARIIHDTLSAGAGVLRLMPVFVPRRSSAPGRRLCLHPDDYFALGTNRGAIKERWFASRLTNLHVADSNRCAPAEGSLDLDTLIRALYLVGYNQPGHFVTPEPIGPGADPYPAMYGMPDTALLEKLVPQTARYFREREEIVRAEG